MKEYLRAIVLLLAILCSNSAQVSAQSESPICYVNDGVIRTDVINNIIELQGLFDKVFGKAYNHSEKLSIDIYEELIQHSHVYARHIPNLISDIHFLMGTNSILGYYRCDFAELCNNYAVSDLAETYDYVGGNIDFFNQLILETIQYYKKVIRKFQRKIKKKDRKLAKIIAHKKSRKFRRKAKVTVKKIRSGITSYRENYGSKFFKCDNADIASSS